MCVLGAAVFQIYAPKVVITKMKPTEIVQRVLANATNLDVVKELVADDATYVSLNYNDPDLKAVGHFFPTER